MRRLGPKLQRIASDSVMDTVTDYVIGCSIGPVMDTAMDVDSMPEDVRASQVFADYS